MRPSSIDIAILQVVTKKLASEGWPGSFEVGVNRLSTRSTPIYVSKDTPITLVGLASSWRNDTICLRRVTEQMEWSPKRPFPRPTTFPRSQA